jgi:hypothetical protein
MCSITLECLSMGSFSSLVFCNTLAFWSHLSVTKKMKCCEYRSDGLLMFLPLFWFLGGLFWLVAELWAHHQHNSIFITLSSSSYFLKLILLTNLQLSLPVRLSEYTFINFVDLNIYFFVFELNPSLLLTIFPCLIFSLSECTECFLRVIVVRGAHHHRFVT